MPPVLSIILFETEVFLFLNLCRKKGLTEQHRIGLTGTAVSDYPDLLPLCQSILSQQGGISLSSLRVDAVTHPLIQCLKEGGYRTVAIAPEAGSERLRKVLRKGYTDEEILRADRYFG